jgi:hypothetical protein
MPTFPTAVGNGSVRLLPGSTELLMIRNDINDNQGHKNLLALSQCWSILYIHVKHVHLLVSLRDFAIFIDPQQGVLDPCASRSRLVNPNIDGHGMFLCRFLET